jgi:hypothetical protein
MTVSPVRVMLLPASTTTVTRTPSGEPIGKENRGCFSVLLRLGRILGQCAYVFLDRRIEQPLQRTEQLESYRRPWDRRYAGVAVRAPFASTLDNNLPSGTVFETIVFNGFSYRLGGNAIGLTGGVSVGMSGGGNTIDLPITLVGDQTLSGDVRFNGPISGSGRVKSTYGGFGSPRFAGTHPFSGVLTGQVVLSTAPSRMPRSTCRRTTRKASWAVSAPSAGR